jgi:hypothetical protein
MPRKKKVDMKEYQPAVIEKHTQSSTLWIVIAVGLLLLIAGIWYVFFRTMPMVEAAGNCSTGYVEKDEHSPFISDNESGNICSLYIKASTQCHYFDSNQTGSCYKVTGLGGKNAKAEKVGHGASCKDISHVEFHSCATPTQTPTPTPTEEPTPTPTEEPKQCEVESWSCGECAADPADDICYKDFVSYCGEQYGCGWVESCPTNGDLKALTDVACSREWVCESSCEPEPTPIPTPQREEKRPEGCTGDCSAPAPVCGEPNTTREPINFHVYRKDGEAILRWWATEGNKVHVYWKENTSENWQHSMTVDNTGYVTVGGLGNGDFTFGIQQVNDCGGGLITVGNILSVVDGGTSRWVLFR